MSSVFTPYTDPTAVDHSAGVYLISRAEKNLVVARSNVLQIYRFMQREEDLTSAVAVNETENEDGPNEDDFLGAGMGIHSSERQIVSKLILVAEYPLFGTIISLCAVRTQDYETSGLESLLVACQTAKVSLLSWDHDLNSLTTVSLHLFERDEYHSPLLKPRQGKMEIDPLSRVATFSFNDGYLAFLPITQKDELQIKDETMDENEEGPIVKSFVLSAAQLEDDITSLKDFAFVDGYREPAIAILYSTEGTTTSLERTWKKDTSKLVVLTLDIQAGARTAIFEITDLPSDLVSVIMVPNPVGGCLLLGTNEIIYIDPASRVVALAVNSFAKASSALPMRDYAQLNILLEGALAVPLLDEETLDGILIILTDGRLALLTLNLDGRTVSSLHLKIITNDFGGDVLASGMVCATIFANKRLFLGSKSGDSKLLAWRRKARASPQAKNGEHIVQDAILDVKEEEESHQDDLEDLYGDEATEKKLFGAETTTFDLRFYIHDTIRNQGPITGMVLSIPYTPEDDERQEGSDPPSLISVVGGSGKAGNLTTYQRSISPEIIGKFDSPDWQALWTVKVRSNTSEIDDTIGTSLDTYLMASKEGDTQVFTIDTAFVEKTDSEFETSDPTIAVGSLLDQTCIVQICPDMMRTYDAELKLLEMKPTPEQSTIISASILDPYVLLVLDDASVALYSGNGKSKELEELSHRINEGQGNACGTLYSSKHEPSVLTKALRQTPDTNSRKRKRSNNEPTLDEGKTPALCFLVTTTGSLVAYQLPSMNQIFCCEHVDHFPDIMTNVLGEVSMNGVSTNADKAKGEPSLIVEVVVADLGQHSRAPFLILRSEAGDVVTYQPYENTHGQLQFSKIKGKVITRPTDATKQVAGHQSQKPQIVVCDNVAGYSCLYLKGSSQWLLKTDKSLPTVHASSLQHVRSLSGFNTLDAPNGFIYCDEESVIRICRLPETLDYSGKWSCRTTRIGRSVHGVAFYAPLQVYALLTSENHRCEIPDDEDEEWQPQQHDRENLPLFPRGSIELLDANTHKIIDRYELAENEQGLCLKSLVLTIATDYTKKKRPCLGVSTGIFRGEDLAMRGAVYVFDIVEVVPEPGQPDSKYRLRNVCREEVRAAATTLAEIDGYLLSAQGQKVVVRSLEEDERLTPVAFVDLGLATTTAKCLRGMILFGDVQKGVRFVGFEEEPYKMTNFGRDYDAMDVMDAEFMIDGKTLYFAASDTTGNLRILQYDPENPTTLAGSRLLRRSDIHTGHVISSMVFLPEVSKDHENGGDEITRSFVVCAALDGSISGIAPISERSYRRLYTIQAQMSSTEPQTAGLNPRQYRLCTSDSLTNNSMKGVLDGQLLLQFPQLDLLTQRGLAQKSGVGVDNVLRDLLDLQSAMSSL